MKNICQLSSILQLCSPPPPSPPLPPPAPAPGLSKGLKAVVSVSTVSGLFVKTRTNNFQQLMMCSCGEWWL